MKRILSLVLCLFVLFSLMPNVKADTSTTACGDAFVEAMIECFGVADLSQAGDTIPDTVIVAYDYENQFILISHADMYYGWLLDSMIEVMAMSTAMKETVESLGLENSVFIIPYDSLPEILEKDIT